VYFLNNNNNNNTVMPVFISCSCTYSFIQEAGWDEDLVNKSYPWVEDKIVQWPKIAPWQAALRDGLLQAGVAPFNGYTYDHVSGTKVGGTIFDETGYRHTAADLLSAGDASNLKVLLHASVHKIVFGSRQGNDMPMYTHEM
jgi:fatty acid omega-hydroxy dehydrogenase